MQFQNIIFDLGGVVVEWDPDGIIAEFSQEPKMAAKLKREVFDHPDWAEKDRGVLSEAEVSKGFASRTGLSEARIEALMRIVRESLRLKADTLPLIDELRQSGFGIYCLSNMPVEHYEHLRKRYDFWEKFDGIVISGLVKMVKPEPGIYQYLLTEYQLAPSTCIFIDDSPRNIEVAKTLGIEGIVFTDVQSCRQQLDGFLSGS